MKKISLFIVSVLIITILFSIPVSAGWFSKFIDDLFKPAKQSADDLSKSIDNTNNKKTTQTAQKTLSKTEQVKVNRIEGLAWEENVRRTLCANAAIRCFDNLDKLKRYRDTNFGYYKEYYITGGLNTQNFINNNKLYISYYYKQPDFIKITEKKVNNKFEFSGIEIVDAKTSTSAIRTEQSIGFEDFCSNTRLPCTVKYAIPQSQAEATRDLVNTGCMFAIGNVVPDPVDVVCILVALG